MSFECKVYQSELRKLGYGLPLYEPNPGEYDRVRIGDVGIADKHGYFLRVFNCLAEAFDDINTRYGVPVDFVPLKLPESAPWTITREPLRKGEWYKSQHVLDIAGDVDFSMTSAPISVSLSVGVSGTTVNAAGFRLEYNGTRTDTKYEGQFKNYMRRNFRSWEQHFHQKRLTFELQDIVLVIGHDLTSKWATTVSSHNTFRGSLAVTAGNSGVSTGSSISSKSEHTLAVPARIGPNEYHPVDPLDFSESGVVSSEAGSAGPFKDQCMFIRGWRIARRIIFSKLEAAAEPEEPDKDRDEDTHSGLVPVGYNSDDEDPVKVDLVDHNYAFNLIFRLSEAEVAIIDESNVCLLAKAVSNKAGYTSLQNLEDLHAIGLDIVLESDTDLQIIVGTLVMSPIPESSTSDGIPSVVLPHRNTVTEGEFNGEEQIVESPSTHHPNTTESQGKASQTQCIGSRISLHRKLRLRLKNFGTVAFSPDLSQIAFGYQDRIELWSTSKGKRLRSMQLNEGLSGNDYRVCSVAFSLDGNCIASGGTNGSILLWDATTGRQARKSSSSHAGAVNTVAFSPDGKCIVSGSDDGTVRCWDAGIVQQTGESFRGHYDRVWSALFSPDGSRIASRSDKAIRIWDAATGMQVGAPLCTNVNWVGSIAFSPNGSHIASGSSNGSIQLMDADTGILVMQLGRELERPVAFAFSPLGNRIVSAFNSGYSIRLWDSLTGTEVMDPLCLDCGPVQTIAFSSDGSRFIFWTGDGRIQCWDINKETITNHLKAISNAFLKRIPTKMRFRRLQRISEIDKAIDEAQRMSEFNEAIDESYIYKGQK